MGDNVSGDSDGNEDEAGVEETLLSGANTFGLVLFAGVSFGQHRWS